MAYSNGFSGDVVSLNHILQTLDRKVVAIPGVTCSDGLSVSAAGEIAYFYTRGKSSVALGNLGDKLTFDAAGVKRVDIPMTKAVQIKSAIPHANFATVSADVVGDRVIQETIEAANKYNEEFVKEISKGNALTGTETITKENAYDVIIDGIKQFKVKNKARGLKPTAIIVGPTVEAALLESPQFIRSTAKGDEVVYEGLVGSIAGLPVVLALDLNEGSTDNLSFILVHKEGFGAPQNVNTLYVTDATAAGYPGGTLISGEIGYGFSLTDKDLCLCKKHA